MPKQRRRRPANRKSAGQPTGRQSVHATQPARSGPRLGLIAAIVGLAVVAAAVALVVFETRTANAPTPRPTPTSVAQAVPTATVDTVARVIDGIPCNAEDVTYHVHAYLEIVNRGNEVPVPANVGIPGGRCLYWLHTHDNSGEIHIEAPRPTRLTLKNFFDIWGQPLSSTQVAGVKVTKGTRMSIYVNRKPWFGDPRSIVLKSHELITIEVGPPFTPPSGFNFGGD